jgi:hypothetical protein
MLHGIWPVAHRENVAGRGRTGNGRTTADRPEGFDGEVVELVLFLAGEEATAL